MQKKKRILTFTLIEMLIVIVIIGILAAALVPRLQSVQGRARDSERKVDLRTIANALEIYRLDNGTYVQLGSTSTYSLIGSSWITGLLSYMTSLPLDPINAGSSRIAITGSHIYRYGLVVTGSSNSYNLAAKVENVNDPDRCEIRGHLYYTTGAPWCHINMVNSYGPAVRYIIEAGPNAR